MLGESPAPVSISIYRNKQIADRLSISETTVSFHIKNLVEKLGANDRAHAVTIAIRRGLLPV
jgi:DNA-binding CsgD family transcriptional regulator